MKAALAAMTFLAGLLMAAPALAEGDVTTVADDYRVVLPPAPAGYVTFETREAKWTFPEHARELVRAMETRRADHMRAIEAQLGVPVVSHVIVRVARNPVEMRAMAPIGLPPPPYAEGVAYPELGIILLALTGPNPTVPVDVPNVFVHELSHVALHRAVNRMPIPRWFSEGVAIHQARERRLERAQTLFDAYGEGRLIPIARLDRAFGSPDDRVINVAYAESASIVAFMLGDVRGRGKLQRLVREIGVGKPFDQALDQAFYMSLPAMHTAWRANLAERYSILPYIVGGTSIWVLSMIAIGFGYTRKRREAKSRLARMGEEEAAIDALDALLAEKLAALEVTETSVEPWEEEPKPRDSGIPVVAHEGEHHTLH